MCTLGPLVRKTRPARQALFHTRGRHFEEGLVWPPCPPHLHVRTNAFGELRVDAVAALEDADDARADGRQLLRDPGVVSSLRQQGKQWEEGAVK